MAASVRGSLPERRGSTRWPWHRTPLWSAARLTTLGALLGCEQPLDPPLQAEAQSFAALPVYARWWTMTEVCSGRTGAFGAVAWYVVPGVRSISDGKTNDLSGYWSRGSNRIVLAGEAQRDGNVVRHEMLHALLRVAGHPRAAFLGGCAGLVECRQACVADAGPPPPSDPAALSVTADALEVTVTVTPAQPSPAIDGGMFTVTVRARNPAPRPVVVALGTRSPSGPGGSFSLDLRSPQLSILVSDPALDASVTRFVAGEIKQRVWEFIIGPDDNRQQLPPGRYQVRAAYDVHWAEAPPVDLVR